MSISISSGFGINSNNGNTDINKNSAQYKAVERNSMASILQSEAMTVSEQLSKNPKLRRDNRIKSIHSSLAIEQNTLTPEQVSDVIDGKRALGPPRDIREAKNAYEAYEAMTRLNPYSVKDLLKAHKIMMEGLVKEAGTFRSKAVCVYAGDQLIHAGTPANYVPDLIGQLFDWLKNRNYIHLLRGVSFIMNLNLYILLLMGMGESAGYGIH